MEANSRIIVQSDWEQILRDRTGEIWLSFKKKGQATVQGKLKCRKLDDALNLSCSNGFHAKQSNQKLVVTYTDEVVTQEQQFQSPNSIFSEIHGAKKNVYCLDVTSGGLGVSCDSAEKTRVWTTDNGEVRRELVGHYGEVSSCRFFPSGLVVVTGGIDTLVKIWSVETGDCPVTLKGHRAGVTDLAIVERGRNIVSSSRDGTVKLWDVGQSACLATFDSVNAGVINACSLGCTSTEVSLGLPQEPAGEREVLTEGKLLLLACQSGSLQGYGLHSRTRVFEMQLSSAVNCCTFLSDNLVACGTDDSSVSVVDLRNTSEPLVTSRESRSAILSLLHHSTGLFVTTGDGSCFLVDKHLQCQLEFTGPDCDPVYRAASDGTHLYTACRDGIVRKYKL